MKRKLEANLGREPTFDYMKGANIDLLDGPGKERMKNGKFFSQFRKKVKRDNGKAKVAPLPNQPPGSHVEYTSKALLQEAQLRAIDPAVIASVISTHLNSGKLAAPPDGKKKLYQVLSGLACKEVPIDREKFPLIASLNEQTPYQLTRLDNRFFRVSSYLVPEMADSKLKALHCIVALSRSNYAERDDVCAMVLDNIAERGPFVSHDGVYFHVSSVNAVAAVPLVIGVATKAAEDVGEAASADLDNHSAYYVTVSKRLAEITRSLSNVHRMRKRALDTLAVLPAANSLLPTGRRMAPPIGKPQTSEQNEDQIKKTLEKQRQERERTANERKRKLEQEAVRQNAERERRTRELRRQAKLKMKQDVQKDSERK